MNFFKKLSIVFAGRNDSYGGDFKTKVLATWKRNYTEMLQRGIEGEWVFVEWNPLDENYFSYILAPLGFRCYIVSQKIHQQVCTNPQMNFMQFFAKNVGIRRATHPWIILTNADVIFGKDILDFICQNELDENLIYRAERRDIQSGLYTASFEQMIDKTVMYYDTNGGIDFVRGAGDFTLYNRQKISYGHDENIRDSDVYIDIRFLYNYKAIHGLNDFSFIKFIGTVFKEDHSLTWRHISHLSASHKGLNKREEYLYCNHPYSLPPDWGLVESSAREIGQNIWLLESLETKIYLMPKTFKVIALLTVRNEEMYLDRCLNHLYNEGIETCLIDNSSSDCTLEIAQSFFNRGVIRIEHFPFDGKFELQKICRNEERLAREINADWFMHHDADEIRQAPAPYKTLLEGIKDADSQGYNAINFDEFVFLPTEDEECFEGRDYVEEMKYYYFFEPTPQRRINIWKKTNEIELYSSGGHQADFLGRRVFPTSFILRHYIVLSRNHAITKYTKRIHSEADLSKGWMLDRANFTPEKLNFPSKNQLKRINESGIWDKSYPWTEHTFLLAKSCMVTISPNQDSHLAIIREKLSQSKARLARMEADFKSIQSDSQ
ncbi:MAG: glycosyltransferase [Microcoleaceae cyanobacterium]